MKLTQVQVVAIVWLPILAVVYYIALIARLIRDFAIEGWKDGKTT